MRRLTLSRAQSFCGPLILVNQDHPVQEGDPVELLAPDGRYPDVCMERRAARLLSACIQATGGSEVIVPVSGWRSRQEQQALWEDTWAREGAEFTQRYVARPGCSEHQTGLAMDLGRAAPFLDPIRPDFPREGPCGAFRRLAARYGFIQRYTREKEGITRIAEEPWHFRYVGVPHALLLEERQLCLEEYVPLLQRGEQVCRLANGRTARVSWLPCPGDTAELPLPDGCWQLSGDNQGGFILTVWEGVS